MRPLRSKWFLVPAAWAVPALLAAFETIVFWRLADRPFPAWRALALQTPGWMVYALLTPLIFALGRHLPLRGAHGMRNAVAHLVAAQLAGVLYAGASTLASLAFSPMRSPTPPARLLLSWWLSALPLATLSYFGVLGVGYALAYMAESRRREVEAAQLAAQLAEARLGALRMQLHPHFLFNSLNAATVLARDGHIDAVARMLTDLSVLLREVMRVDGAHEISLEAELDFVRRYLAVEEVRFSDRLRVHIAADTTLHGALVPRFVLQPLVENALRHGIARRTAAGRLAIGAHRGAHAGELVLTVHDDGAGLPDDWGAAEDYGVGLTNTAQRLAQLHGTAAALTLAPAGEGGTVATVRLPLRYPPSIVAAG